MSPFVNFEKLLEKNSFRYADKVSIGDDIVVKENKDVTPAKVASVWSQVMNGNHCFLPSVVYFGVSFNSAAFSFFLIWKYCSSNKFMWQSWHTFYFLVFLYQTQ